jgi:hypothetical protein
MSENYKNFIDKVRDLYVSQQDEWIAENNIVVGSKVLITRDVYTPGWDDVWDKEMNALVDSVGYVANICSSSGIQVSTNGEHWYFPFTSLEPVIEENEYLIIERRPKGVSAYYEKESIFRIREENFGEYRVSDSVLENEPILKKALKLDQYIAIKLKNQD